MSDDADTWWDQSPNRCFNFDDEESTDPAPTVKTAETVLAASTSQEPFLSPSVITCNNDNVKKLIDFYPSQQVVVQRKDPRTYISEIVEKRIPIDFSPYKSKREKLLLLDSSICSSDGNLITAATIFMSKTLKESIFVEELKKRPIALDHYLNYLNMTGRVVESMQLIKMLSKNTV